MPDSRRRTDIGGSVEGASDCWRRRHQPGHVALLLGASPASRSAVVTRRVRQAGRRDEIYCGAAAAESPDDDMAVLDRLPEDEHAGMS
jgi:hypothetical protein